MGSKSLMESECLTDFMQIGVAHVTCIGTMNTFMAVCSILMACQCHQYHQAEHQGPWTSCLCFCTGGWAVGSCPHAVVYCVKSLLRSESARDYIDLEQSLKHRPNVSISDIAHLLARHGNKRSPNYFTPNEGRLGPATADNIEAANRGDALMDAGFLQEIPVSPNHHPQNVNPTTGSSCHYALYDWFHENNCKDPKEGLRKISLLSGLAGIIDTQVVEQLFSSFGRDLYFLNRMSPHVHLFVFRLLCQLRNVERNKKLVKVQEQLLGKDVGFNQLGQLCQSYGNVSIPNDSSPPPDISVTIPECEVHIDTNDETFIPTPECEVHIDTNDETFIPTLDSKAKRVPLKEDKIHRPAPKRLHSYTAHIFVPLFVTVIYIHLVQFMLCYFIAPNSVFYLNVQFSF